MTDKSKKHEKHPKHEKHAPKEISKKQLRNVHGGIVKGDEQTAKVPKWLKN
jgi:hypothetical protein